MTEIWKPVVGYEKYYEVSNLGRVRSLDRVMTSTTGKQFVKKGRVLRQTKNKSNGYFMLSFRVEGNTKTFTVHRLVATAFVENPNGLGVVNHKNEVKSDNRPENLEWCTKYYKSTLYTL